MWYSFGMKRSGACSLRKVGSPRRGDRLRANRPRTPRRGVPTIHVPDATVVEQTQAVHFGGFSGFFLQVSMLGEHDRLGRRGVRLAPRPERNETNWDVFGETPNPATETVALP